MRGCGLPARSRTPTIRRKCANSGTARSRTYPGLIIPRPGGRGASGRRARSGRSARSARRRQLDQLDPRVPPHQATAVLDRHHVVVGAVQDPDRVRRAVRVEEHRRVGRVHRLVATEEVADRAVAHADRGGGAQVADGRDRHDRVAGRAGRGQPEHEVPAGRVAGQHGPPGRHTDALEQRRRRGGGRPHVVTGGRPAAAGADPAVLRQGHREAVVGERPRQRTHVGPVVGRPPEPAVHERDDGVGRAVGQEHVDHGVRPLVVPQHGVGQRTGGVEDAHGPPP